jgi:hypothetical protein
VACSSSCGKTPFWYRLAPTPHPTRHDLRSGYAHSLCGESCRDAWCFVSGANLILPFARIHGQICEIETAGFIHASR